MQGSAIPPIIVITGPTAVGKSAAALELAAAFGGEIISADSRQVYRHLDIGTAKPTAHEQALVPHRLIDLVEPDEPYSVVHYRADADRGLAEVAARGRVAFLVGGSPHYLQAVIDRLEVPPVPPQDQFRREMEEWARREGHQSLHDRLREVDPEGAEQIAATNVRRVIRALEVHHVTGVPFSDLGRRRGTPLPALKLALTIERSALHKSIDDRVERQVASGLIEEARGVVQMGYDPGLPPLAGLVYREAISAAFGRIGLEDAVRRMKETTHAFARRQYTWLRREPDLNWIEVGTDHLDLMNRMIWEYLAGPR